MADFGTTTGIGTGIGQALAAIGQGLEKRGERRDAERDKQAGLYEKQAQSIASNIAQLGGASNPAAAPLMQQLNQVIAQHNALWPMHETRGLIDRIKGFVGKGSGGTWEQDPRGTMTAEETLAEAPLPQNKLLQDRADFIQAAGLEGIDPVTAGKQWWNLQTTKTAGGATDRANLIGVAKWDPAKGTWTQQAYDPVTRQTETVDLGAGYAQKPVTGQLSEDKLEALSTRWEKAGVAPENPKDREAVAIWRTQHGLGEPVVFGKDKGGQLASWIFGSGKAGTDRGLALQMAQKQLADESAAKSAIATGHNITYDQAVAMVNQQIAFGTPPPISRRADSPDFILYRQAFADVTMGANAPNLMAVKDKRAAFEGALRQQTQLMAGTRVNEETAKKYFNQVLLLNAKVTQNTWQTAFPIINRFIDSGYLEVTGNADVNNLTTAVTEALTEYAKVVSGQTTGAGVTDSARQAMHALYDPANPIASSTSWVKTVALPFMKARTDSQQENLNLLNEGLRDALTLPQPGPQPPRPGPQPTPAPQGRTPSADVARENRRAQQDEPVEVIRKSDGVKGTMSRKKYEANKDKYDLANP